VSIHRGKVLKVPDATPGILFVNGQQKSFQINGLWRSASIAPASNLNVDVELNEAGQVLSVRPVSESELAKEQLLLSQRFAQEKIKALAGAAVARIGKSILIATALLIVAWFFLDLFSFRMTFFFPINIHPTFWQSIGAIKAVQDLVDNPLQAIEQVSTSLSTGRGSKGFYGILAILCLVGPLLPLLWKDKRAHLGALLPLLFTLFLAFQCYRIVAAVKDMGRSAVAQSGVTAEQLASAQNLAGDEFKELSKSVKFHLGLGFYLCVGATLFLAGAGIRKYLVLKASPEVIDGAEPVAWTAPAPSAKINAPPPLSSQANTNRSCHKCHQSVDLGSSFCAECGERVV